jgi:DNA polymerase V
VREIKYNQEAALKGLKSIYRSDCIYKKVGVIVGKIVPQDKVKMSLFDKVDRNKRKNLMQTVDKVNKLMGRDTIKLAVQGKGRDWKLKQEKLSPCYTNRFADVLTIKI